MGIYCGLFLVSLATLMFEVLLTRIFSVVSWYYFAFLAVSVAMFGMSAGALAVYIGKQYFPEEKLYRRLGSLAVSCGLAMAVSLMIFLCIPFHPRPSGVGIFSTIFIFLVIAVPFACAGAVVCLCLTRFPKKIGLLYATDLIGAAMGAFLLFPVLDTMDAPTAVFLVSAIAALGGLCFARSAHAKSLIIIAFVLMSLTPLNYFLRLFRIEWVQLRYSPAVSESWNSFSRVAVYPLRWVMNPHGWGYSTVYQPKKPIGEILLEVDGIAEIAITRYDGTAESIEHLKYDVAAIANYLRSPAKVFIIGVGGGRDVLAAKAFNQPLIFGAEINNRILEMVNSTFADFSGHLDQLPGVKIIHDEARSAITRMNERFDIIQASNIATWSSTSAGALTLAENSLYTTEAWKIFFEHLSPQGILSFNRWYAPDYPAQVLRLCSLAVEMLKEQGIDEPGKHIAVVRSDMRSNMFESGTILVSKAPFSAPDLDRLKSVVADLKFKLEYEPNGEQNPLFKAIVDNAGKKAFYASTPLDISAPSDDRPFFYAMLRFPDIFKAQRPHYQEQQFNLIGIRMLYIILGASLLLCCLLIFGPLVYLKGANPLLNQGWVAMIFFASIGFGYILVEMAQLQRLIIFLGHPIYSITVVLFSLLFASGLGALLSNRWISAHCLKPGKIILSLAMLLVALLLTIYKQPDVLSAFVKYGIRIRVIAALFFLIPLGFLMGLPFPLGMSLASTKFSEHTPWYWAVNGATSVVASVLSVCISMLWGFTVTLSTGFYAYLVAAVFIIVLYKIANPSLQLPRK